MHRSLVAALTLAIAGQLPAQTLGPGSATALGQRAELGPWFGLSLHSPVGRHWGITPGREFYLVGVRYARRVAGTATASLFYISDALPLAVVSDNPDYRLERYRLREGRVVERKHVTGTGPVYGAGLSPVGLELRIGLGRRVAVFGGGTAGFLVFSREVPVPDARRFNYTFDAGGGMRLTRGGRRVLILGFKFHHLSNDYSAPANPGLDAHVFYAGLVYRRSRPTLPDDKLR